MSITERIRAYRPQRPKREPDAPHIRERLQEKIRLRREWETSGKMYAKNPDGSWRYTVEDLNREAEAQIADLNRNRA